MRWELENLIYAIKLQEENVILFKYLTKKKNINPWTKELVEQIIKLNLSIIDNLTRK